VKGIGKDLHASAEVQDKMQGGVMIAAAEAQDEMQRSCGDTL
jgi:hypothetical protein